MRSGTRCASGPGAGGAVGAAGAARGSSRSTCEPPAGVRLQPIAKVTGWGPSADARRPGGLGGVAVGGPVVHLLDTASPPGAVVGLPARDGRRRSPGSLLDERVAAALDSGA